jgi:hypothetical protein
MKPKFSVYIPSRGRSDTCLTAEILKSEGINFKIVIEPQDRDDYVSKYGEESCLVMDKNNMGIAYVRNWIKDYSKRKKEEYHWQIDDNIKNFRFRNNNKNEKTTAGFCLANAENYIVKFINIGIAGLTHTAFAFSHKEDIGLNKQCYSCVLIKNDILIRYREGLVEDTDYSLQLLTKGYCTILFYKLLIEKAKTMSMKGGNTEIEYSGNKRELRTKELIKCWPGVFKYTYQYGRIKVLPSRVWRMFSQRPILK